MPFYDSIDAFYDIFTSSIAVSGKAPFITLAKDITSGDAMSTIKVSGANQWIYLRQGRTEIRALTNRLLVEHADFVDIEVGTKPGRTAWKPPRAEPAR